MGYRFPLTGDGAKRSPSDRSVPRQRSHVRVPPALNGPSLPGIRVRRRRHRMAITVVAGALTLLSTACMELPQAVPFGPDDVNAARAHLGDARARLLEPSWGPSGPRAILLVEVGLWEDGEAVMGEIDDPEERELARAVLELRRRNYPGVSESVNRLLELNEENVSALVLRGTMELERGDLVTARRTGERILEIEGQDPDAATLLGRIRLERREDGEAMDWARRAQRWDPTHLDAHVLEARVRLYRGQSAAARETLERTLRIDPLHPEARFLYGEIRRREGGSRAAAIAWSHWQLALAVDPLHRRPPPGSR